MERFASSCRSRAACRSSTSWRATAPETRRGTFARCSRGRARRKRSSPAGCVALRFTLVDSFLRGAAPLPFELELDLAHSFSDAPEAAMTILTATATLFLADDDGRLSGSSALR